MCGDPRGPHLLLRHGDRLSRSRCAGQPLRGPPRAAVRSGAVRGILMAHPLFWVPLTLVAAALQVVRNGAQANLTGKIGTLGATQVRFVFGLPFALLFLTGA